jgi:hypothetical protein
LDKFLSTNEAFNEIKNIQKPIHLVNMSNIILILIQVFFYSTLLTCIFPVLYFYLYICGLEHDDEIDEFWFLNILTFLDVGSIYLGKTKTDFDFTNDTGEKNAHMRSSGVFLHEDGRAGLISQIDI